MSIHRVAVSIGAGDSTKTLKSGVAGSKLRLIALHLTTEGSDADIIIKDSDGTALSGEIHCGTGTGGWHHSEIHLTPNKWGWVETAYGKGLIVSNEDSATISGIAVIEAYPSIAE